MDVIASIDLELGELEPPPGQFVRAVRFGRLLMLAGTGAPGPRPGKVGREISKEEARTTARATGIRLLSAIRGELGQLDRVERILQVRGFVNAVADFTDHPFVIDGCSELFVQRFGDAGRHARTSVGVASLPGGIPVEIEAIAAIR